MATKTKLNISDYRAEKSALDSRLAFASARRRAALDREKTATEEETARALRSKYIESRVSTRRLPQIAAAKGLSGGAVKNVFRGISGEYSAVRNNLTAERDSAIARLVEEYSQSEAKDSESYAEKLATLKRKYAEVLALEELRKRYPSYSGGSRPRNTRVIVIGGDK